jgi:hypothetical protein
MFKEPIRPQAKRQTLTVDVTAGHYSNFGKDGITGVLYLNAWNSNRVPARVVEAQVFVESLPAAATIEVDLLKPGSDPTQAASWNLAVDSINSTGLKTAQAFTGWPGVRYRLKSGGTAGDAIVSVSYIAG